MGWSCNAAAGLTMDAAAEILRHKADLATPKDSPLRAGQDSYHPGEVSSNAMPGGFWERSNNEHDDGAITGSVWAYVGPDRCKRVGSFRINGNGTIARFPGLTQEERCEAAARGMARYVERYGEPTFGQARW